MRDFALPFSAECLKSITGLTNMRFEDMNAWSQGMIDGIANYTGDPAVEARCHAATAGIDAAIDDMVPVLDEKAGPEPARRDAGVGYADAKRARQHQACHQRRPERAARRHRRHRLGAAHSSRAARAAAERKNSLAAGVRGICPLDLADRHVAAPDRKPWTIRDVAFEPDERVFLMFGSANRDEKHFANPEAFDIRRDTSKSIAFGAGPHFCAGASASRAMVADVALPAIFSRLKNLRLSEREPVRIGGWAFRGLLNLPVTWGQ